MNVTDPLLCRSLRVFAALKPRMDRIGLPLWIRGPDVTLDQKSIPPTWTAHPSGADFEDELQQVLRAMG